MAEANENKNTASEEQSVETENQSAAQLRILNDKLYAEAKSLRTENKDRRLKNEEYEKREKEREDATLSKTEKLTKERDTAVKAYDDLKVSTAQKDLNGQFTQKVVEAGLPAKIAKVATPSDLSEDNMKDKVKEAVKEFSEFVKTEEKGKPKSNNPFPGVQPQPDGSRKKPVTGKLDAVLSEFNEHINREK